jgi:hypothetical protein
MTQQFCIASLLECNIEGMMGSLERIQLTEFAEAGYPDTLWVEWG